MPIKVTNEVPSTKEPSFGLPEAGKFYRRRPNLHFQPGEVYFAVKHLGRPSLRMAVLCNLRDGSCWDADGGFGGKPADWEEITDGEFIIRAVKQ